MLGFESIGSAILIAYDGAPILTTDAWINDDAYFGSWTHDWDIPPAQLDAIKRAKYHWLSHGHPDHLNIESLPLLSGGQFLLSDHFGGRIRRELEERGYDVRVLKDHEWTPLSARIKVYSIANVNQDSILLIDINGTLIVNTNDSPDFGASFHVQRIARNYKRVFYCALHGWGGADMLNMFDASGRKLTEPGELRRPIAPRAQRGARTHGAHYAIPFSGFHRYQRNDSLWANGLMPELDDYQSHAEKTGPQMLPAFVRVNVVNGTIERIDPPRRELRPKKPEEFGDNWCDPMTKEDITLIENYFRAREHLADRFDFVGVTIGGKSHTVNLARSNKGAGIVFEAPRYSFVTCLKEEIFDDLLIGNYMKTTLHGVDSLYPDFSPYVAKYGDNGHAKSRTELRRYFLHYFLRDPIASALNRVTTSSEQVLRALVPADSVVFKSAKRLYYSMGPRRP